MLRRDDGGYTHRTDRLVHGVHELVREAFLDLWTMREDVQRPCQLARPDDAAVGHVAYMSAPEEREEMVFADGEKRYVFKYIARS